MDTADTQKPRTPISVLAFRAQSLLGLALAPLGLLIIFQGQSFLGFGMEGSVYLGIAFIMMALGFAHTTRLFAGEAEIADSGPLLGDPQA